MFSTIASLAILNFCVNFISRHPLMLKCSSASLSHNISCPSELPSLYMLKISYKWDTSLVSKVEGGC